MLNKLGNYNMPENWKTIAEIQRKRNELLEQENKNLRTAYTHAIACFAKIKKVVDAAIYVEDIDEISHVIDNCILECKTLRNSS